MSVAVESNRSFMYKNHIALTPDRANVDAIRTRLNCRSFLCDKCSDIPGTGLASASAFNVDGDGDGGGDGDGDGGGGLSPIGWL